MASFLMVPKPLILCMGNNMAMPRTAKMHHHRLRARASEHSPRLMGPGLSPSSS